MNIDNLLNKLYELALDRNKIKQDLNNQMVPLFQHIAKLQLYGYNSDIIKTIYDIYFSLSDFNDTKIGRKYLTDKNVKSWLLDFVVDEEDYTNALKRLDKKFKGKYFTKQRNISYLRFLNLQDYIKRLLVEDILEEKETFYSNIVAILDLKED